MPGLIDPHVHFRIPGQAYKEDWTTAAKASIQGGYTTVFDMPNNVPACVSQQRLQEKITLIEQQLKQADIPLRYGLYLGADYHHLDQIPLVKNQIVGVKVFMGSSTGDLLMNEESALHGVFAICAKLGLMVAVHAEDECEIQQRKVQFKDSTDFAVHSKIRTPEVAEKAVKLAIHLAELYDTKLYILHVSTRHELAHIRAAKATGLPIYAEVCPHHLFLNVDAYTQLGAKAQMNPPLRLTEHQTALWEAIHDGTIDTVGSDHAPHTMEEKSQPYGKAPSGVPGIETTLPLLLDAYHRGKISLAKIVYLTHTRPKAMFELPDYDDVVLVDLATEKTVGEHPLYTKCQWSPFAGMKLHGWPKYVVVQGKLFSLS